jgi:hypothetical protein
MEVGQIGPLIQLVVLLVVEVYNCILEVVQIRHQMRLGRFVLESRTMRTFPIKTIVCVRSIENERNLI